MPDAGPTPTPDDLPTPSPGTIAYDTPAAADPKVGEHPNRIGDFHILEVLGQGGMGIVYLAEQKEPVRRRVALKLIKLGMDTTEIIKRFLAERQALALMSHPNIAGVLDAGTSPEGRPYFVMEHVPGIPITQYCDKHKLGVEERLELFIPVCEAVQHAHSKGVIHRDLKPSNVLVMMRDGRPAAKVIDFGLAKITAAGMSDRTLFTQHGQMIGTPAYMSPEQAEMSGLDIDTRADVYSLGAMLYELLAGAAPFDPKLLRQMSYSEMQRTIREVDPPKPSTKLSKLGERANKTAEQRHVQPHALARQLSGDLDWIILKAMEKDRTRRYATPLELAADLRRHLDHELVLARPPTLTYRVSRFARRHRGTVVAASVALLSLIAALVAMTWLYLNADAAQRQAEEHRREAELVNTFLIEDLLAEASPDRNPVESAKVLAKILDRAAKRVDVVLADQPHLEAPLRRTLGRTYASLDRDAEAEPHLRAALRIYEQRYGPENPETLAVVNALVWSLFTQGSLKPEKLAEARKLGEDALKTSTRALGPEHAATLGARSNWADLLSRQGKHAEAEKEFLAVLTIRRQALGPDHERTLFIKDRLAFEHYKQEQYDTGESLQREVFESRERIQGKQHPATLTSKHMLILMLSAQGNLKDALPLAVENLKAQRSVLGADHSRTLSSVGALASLMYHDGKMAEAAGLYRELAENSARTKGEDDEQTLQALGSLGNSLAAQNKYLEAEEQYKRVLDACKRRQDKGSPLLRNTTSSLASLLQRQGKLSAAEARYREALTMSPSKPGEEGLTALYVLHSLSGLLLDKEPVESPALAEAETLCQAALAGRQKKLPAVHRSIADSQLTLCRVFLAKGQPRLAESQVRSALQIYEAKPRTDDWDVALARSLLGACLVADKRHAEAEPLVVDAYAALERSPGCPPLRKRQSFERVIQLYKDWNKAEKVSEWEAKRGK